MRERKRSARSEPVVSGGKAVSRHGVPLDPSTLAWSHRAFGFDFSHVRVHRGGEASRAASARNALAFTQGHDIFLADGRDASDVATRTRLAHELTHVVQQSGRRVEPGTLERTDSPVESVAHSVAARVMAGGRAPAVRHTTSSVGRDVGFAGRGPIPDPHGMGYNEILKRAGAAAEPAVRDLASCEDAKMKFDRAKFDLLSPDRRAAVLALRPHAKGTACEAWFDALALASGGGDFVMTQYDAFDGDPGQDTKKKCGIDLKITFTPAKSLRSDKISFVQMMKAEKSGVTFLFENEKPRATTAAQGEEGWVVDRLAGNKNADYQITNAGVESASWGQIGHRKSDADVRDATLIDTVRLTRDAGATAKVRATSFALDKTNSKYLGGVAWGYDVNAAGVVTKTKESIQSTGAPTGVQKAALEQWNEQAKNPDVSKRNAPDQVEITVP